jgi:hypothetical protein
LVVPQFNQGRNFRSDHSEHFVDRHRHVGATFRLWSRQSDPQVFFVDANDFEQLVALLKSEFSLAWPGRYPVIGGRWHEETYLRWRRSRS